MDYHKLLLTAFSTFDMLNPKLLFPVNLTSCFLIPFMPFIPPLFHCIDVLMCLSLPLFCTKKHLCAVRVRTEPKKTSECQKLASSFYHLCYSLAFLGCHYSFQILVNWWTCSQNAAPKNSFPGFEVKPC